MSRKEWYPWVPETVQLLTELWNGGRSGKYIARRLLEARPGSRLEVPAVYAKARLLGLPKRKRGGKNGQVDPSPRAVATNSPAPKIHQVYHGPLVTAEQVREVHERLSAPRSLTAEILGDPRPGQSALDKIRSGLPC